MNFQLVPSRTRVRGLGGTPAAEADTDATAVPAAGGGELAPPRHAMGAASKATNGSIRALVRVVIIERSPEEIAQLHLSELVAKVGPRFGGAPLVTVTN
jgi:hypothetical protein